MTGTARCRRRMRNLTDHSRIGFSGHDNNQAAVVSSLINRLPSLESSLKTSLGIIGQP